MLKKGLFLILSGLFLFPVITSAAEAFNLQTLQQLFNTYKRQKAYDYARQYVDQQEGDPYFDYLYGVAAIDTGHASQGVFALERVLLTFPEDHVARLELARGYFILEEYSRARLEFEKVLAYNPPREVQETTQQFLDQIRLKEARYRTTSSGFVSLAIGSDSNVNSGADDGVTIIDLDEQSLGQDDTFSELVAAWQIGHPFAPGWMMSGNITGAFRINQDHDEFDTNTATLQFGVSRLYKESRYKAELLYQTYQLDGDDYRDLAGMNLEWHYSLTQKSRLSSTLQYVNLEYPETESRNSDLATLSLTYTHSFAILLNPTFFATLNLGAEIAEDDSNANALSDTERDITGIRVGSILGLSPKLALQISAGYQSSEYAGEQTFPLFAGIVREDDFTSADINLLWLFHKDWRLDTKISYTENSSNIELYNYDRTVFSLNLNYAF
ncbi:MAG: surface lipoprotein assembly modifier [Gammaproteobacteria bacterium]|nr:surface lipoprotein assembly modifier [Gammaproteobacteria bacterium]